MSDSSSLSLDWGLRFDVCGLVLGSQLWGRELFFGGLASQADSCSTFLPRVTEVQESSQ